MTQYGAGANDTGSPIGGGPGYAEILTKGNKYVTTAAEVKAALKSAVSGDVIFVGKGTVNITVKVRGE